MNSKTISIAGYLMAVTGLLIMIYSGWILSVNPPAIIIQIVSVLFMVWARVTFGRRSFHAVATTTRGELVTTGPYRWLRHPIYASVIWFSWACLISFHKPATLGAVLLITAGLVIRMVTEEKELRRTYPEYSSYCTKTKRIIPFIF